MSLAIDPSSYEELKSQLSQAESDAGRMSAEIKRLRDAVWEALPWLDDLQHMGSIVDQERRAATVARLQAALNGSSVEIG